MFESHTETKHTISVQQEIPRGILDAVKEGVAERHIVTMLRLWQPNFGIRQSFDIAEALKQKFFVAE
jgi:hypothetical protein